MLGSTTSGRELEADFNTVRHHWISRNSPSNALLCGQVREGNMKELSTSAT